MQTLRYLENVNILNILAWDNYCNEKLMCKSCETQQWLLPMHLEIEWNKVWAKFEQHPKNLFKNLGFYWFFCGRSLASVTLKPTRVQYFTLEWMRNMKLWSNDWVWLQVDSLVSSSICWICCSRYSVFLGSDFNGTPNSTLAISLFEHLCCQYWYTPVWDPLSLHQGVHPGFVSSWVLPFSISIDHSALSFLNT